jgi:hypothetical protein
MYVMTSMVAADANFYQQELYPLFVNCFCLVILTEYS